MTDSTSGTRTPPPPPPKKRPPPPPPPPKKSNDVPATSAPSQPVSPSSNALKKSLVGIVASVAVLLLAAVGIGTWFQHSKKADADRIAQEKVQQEEDLRKQEADKAAKASAALHEQVAAVLSQSRVPLDRASPNIQIMLDGSAANNEPAIASAQHEIEALPKPARGDSVLAVKLANEAVELDRKKDSIGAISLLLKAEAADQSDAGILLKLSELLRNAGHLQDSDTACRLALTLNPSDPTAWFYEAGVIAMQGKKEASVGAYLNYVRFSSNKKDARALLESIANDENVIPAVRDATKAVLASSALMLVESRSSPLAAKARDVEPPSTPNASTTATTSTSAQKSWRVPGRITLAVAVNAGASNPCKPDDFQHIEHRTTSPGANRVYCVVAESNQAAPDGTRVHHTWASDYPYVQGTTLYLRVFEDGRIVIE